MGSQHLIWCIQHANIFQKTFQFSSIWMILKFIKNMQKRLNGWKKKRKYFLQLTFIRDILLLNQMQVLFMMMVSNAIAGVRKTRCARVETKKAQICRLSLLNIVRCIMNVDTIMIAPCGLTRNIPVRCYV